jgi:hypothetical protein
MMKKAIFLLALSYSFVGFSGTIQWGITSYETVDGGGPSVNKGIFNEFIFIFNGIPETIEMAIFINETQSINPSYASLAASTTEYIASYSQRWRVFTEGEALNYNVFFGDYNDYFFRLSGGASSDRAVDIPRNGSVYLGFVEENDLIYGWVQLGFDGTSVYVMNSAVDISGDSIIVGVPEPATLMLMMVGLAAVGRRRRHVRLGKEYGEARNHQNGRMNKLGNIHHGI